MGDHINESFKKELRNIIIKKKLWLLIYTGLTMVNYAIDSVGFVIMLFMFGKAGHEYSDLFMIFIISIFLAGDSIYIFWGIGVYMKLPKQLAKSVFKTIVGLANSLTIRLNSTLYSAREKARTIRA